MDDNFNWLQQIVVEHITSKQGDSSKKTDGLFPDGFPNNIGDAWQLATQMLKISDQELVEMVAKSSGYGVANLKDIKRKNYTLVPENLARRYGVFPIMDDGNKNELFLATSDPNITEAFQLINFTSGRKIKPMIASPIEIDNAILSHYYNLTGSSVMTGKQGSSVIIIEDEEQPSEYKTKEPDSKIVKLTSMLVKKAIESNASDIHIQPFLGGAIVRFRIDGVLQRITSLPPTVAGHIIRRFKAVASMDPTNHMIPQDGSARVLYKEDVFDLRVSTLPTGDLERLVIRLLHERTSYSLDKVGMPDEDVEQLKKLIQYKSGIIIITGPTGSGKTTTLYSCLSELNTVDRNIITAEDPVEYRLHGASQVAINAKQGLDYAAVVRSVLRQDPDILLIGEVRDPETAEYAFRAALTGHVVFTTLHTSDAISAIERLRDLGISHRDIAYNVIAMTAQRLLRKLCDVCEVPVSEPLNAIEKVFFDITGKQPKCRPLGCSECNQLGYKGRQPITQIVEFTPTLTKLLTSDAPLSEIITLARKEGMRTLGKAAHDIIIEGKTTIGEALRVLGPSFWDDINAEYNETTEVSIPTDAFIEPVSLAETEKLYEGTARLLFISLSKQLISDINTILKSDNYSIMTASNIDQARQLVDQFHSFDIMIIDLTQQGGNGIELLDNVWQEMKLRSIRILVIMSDDDKEIIPQLTYHAAFDFILDYVNESQCQELLDTRIQRILHRAEFQL